MSKTNVISCVMFSEYYHNSVPGEQPIRALYPLWWKNYLFFRLYHFDKKWIDFKVNYDCFDRNKTSPYISGDTITLPETFLSFLWCYSYALATLTPRPNQNLTKGARDRAYKLLADLSKLLNGEKFWDKEEYPNPELLRKDEIEHGVAAMTIFLGAMAFVLNHEIAHNVLGHIEEPSPIVKRRKEMEYEADKFAIMNLIPKNGDMNKLEVLRFKLGTITALLSLIISTPEVSGGANHPDPDHRVKRAIEYMKLSDSEEQVWGYAAHGLMLWGIVNKRPHPFPKRLTSSKQYFLDLLAGFDEVKRT